MSKGLYINDSIHGLIQLSEYEKRIISSIGFNRLHDVYQNSTVYLTFPSNRTKRFEHSLGTMKLASDMFYRSVLNSSAEILVLFYEKMIKKIKEIIDSIKQDSELCENKLSGISARINFDNLTIEKDKMQHSLTPSNVDEKYKKIHYIIIEAIRVAALLHDVGHPPFSHVVENALKRIYLKYNNSNNNSDRILKFCKAMQKYFENGKQLHEEMGDEISKNILYKIVPSTIDKDYKEKNFNKNLLELIILKCVLKIFENDDIFATLHSIIDGSLDCDRLDYVTRDSVNSGMNSGKIEYQRIINDMKLKEKNGQFFFCVPRKAVNSVEDFAKRRLAIYKNIIYHHRVVKTDSLLQFSVEKIIDKFLTNDKEKFIKGGEKRFSNGIPYDISGLWYPLNDVDSGGTATEKETALSQWNDSWLITILKQLYYSEFYQKDFDKKTSDYILSKQMTELLCNTRNYRSLIKRSENFIVIDNEFRKVLKASADNINNKINQVQKLSKKLVKNLNNSFNNTNIINIEGTLKTINRIIKPSNDSKTLSLWYLFKNKNALLINDDTFEEIINNVIENSVTKAFGKDKFSDIMIIHKRMKTGLEKPIYFYATQNIEISTLDENSGIQDILNTEVECLPMFYVYILINDEVKFDDERNNLLVQIGNDLGKCFSSSIIEFLNKIKENMENINV